MYRSFGIHKKRSSLAPLSPDKYEANLNSVADYIKCSVNEVKEISGKNATNGPEPYLRRQLPLYKWSRMVSRS